MLLGPPERQTSSTAASSGLSGLGSPRVASRSSVSRPHLGHLDATVYEIEWCAQVDVDLGSRLCLPANDALRVLRWRADSPASPRGLAEIGRERGGEPAAKLVAAAKASEASGEHTLSLNHTGGLFLQARSPVSIPVRSTEMGPRNRALSAFSARLRLP